MIRTFGPGRRAKKRRFWAFGIGPPAEIVDKSQGKYENNALGKKTVLGPFWGPWLTISCQERSHFCLCPQCFLSFCVFYHLTTLHNTHTHTHTTRISLFPLGFQCFSTRTHAHTCTHTHTHTHTPAIDRYLARGLRESVCVNTRKNREICLKKAKSGETLAKARFDIDGQIVRLRRNGERRIEPSGSWFPPNFPSFPGKSE